METQTQSRPQPPKAAGLTNILNKEEHPVNLNGAPQQLRDSGFYSTADVSSKRKSMLSPLRGSVAFADLMLQTPQRRPLASMA